MTDIPPHVRMLDDDLEGLTTEFANGVLEAIPVAGYGYVGAVVRHVQGSPGTTGHRVVVVTSLTCNDDDEASALIDELRPVIERHCSKICRGAVEHLSSDDFPRPS